jgi:hypothetical protein
LSDLAGCRENFSQSAAVFAEIKQSGLMAGVMLYLCLAELYLGDVEQAQRMFEAPAKELIDLGYLAIFPYIYSLSASLSIRQNECIKAKTTILQCVQFFADHPHQYDESDIPFLLIGKYVWIVLQEGRSQLAAQLLGMAEALRKTCNVRTPAVRLAEYDATISCVRAALDESTFATCYAKGHAMKGEEIFAWIMGQEG